MAEDRATHLLSKFCCTDSAVLRQHVLWREASQHRTADVDASMQELKERVAQLQDILTKTIEKDEKTQQPQRGPSVRLGSNNGDSNMHLSTAGVDSIMESSGEQSDTRYRGDAMWRDMPHQPRTKQEPISELTEAILGQTRADSGSAVIIDMARGVYYLCGSLRDDGTVLRFLGGWRDGRLDSFDIGLMNPDELLKEDEHDSLPPHMHERLVMAPNMWNLPLPNPMPCIIIWVPTLQHSRTGETPSNLFKALLHYAFRRCPRQDEAVTWSEHGVAMRDYDQDGLPREGFGERLMPWIEKVWIFGLLAGEEASRETGMGDWEPAPDPFLVELHSYINKLVKQQLLEDIREQSEGESGERSPSKHKMSGNLSLAGSLSPGPNQLRTGSSAGSRRSSVSDRNFQLVSRSQVFDAGLKLLRESHPEERMTIRGNYNLTMRTAKSRHTLYKMILDELSYHCVLQYPPPPLFVLLAGDMPPHGAVPWPSVLRQVHFNVVGHVPDPHLQREISPAMAFVDWERWTRNSLDPQIPTAVARNIALPL
mmetsp:Transcript_20673/g.59031  ORF Transcript_20673/g.59031 Transcript_20673/m.59031 type:complete len:538 (-) Transcript_20673:30-1643(-)